MDVILFSIPFFFALIGIEIVVERWQHRQLYRLNDSLTNLSCGITSQLFGVLTKSFTFAAYLVVYHYARLATLPTTWYTLLLLFVAYDLCFYFAHRASHVVHLFWAGHVVHHQSEEYNLSVALRQSAAEQVFTVPFYLPLALLGFHPESMLFVSAVNLVYQFWVHTETIGKLGWLEFVLNTPSHHRVHHGRNPEYIDKNFAGMFIVWDRLFRTFEPEQAEVVYGVTTPVASWNPVYAQTAHFFTLWHDLRRIPSFADKVRYLVRKPGWYPSGLGGVVTPPPVERATAKKYDVPLPLALNRYLLVQYILVLLASAAALAVLPHVSYTVQGIIALIITVHLVVLGFMLEAKPAAVGWEFVRLVMLPFVASESLKFGGVSDPALYWSGVLFATIWAVVSAGWLQQQQQQP